MINTKLPIIKKSIDEKSNKLTVIEDTINVGGNQRRLNQIIDKRT